MGRFARSRLGKLALGGLVFAAATGGATKLIGDAMHRSQVRYEATQGEIAPIIEQSMVGVDVQAVDYQLSHPDDVRVVHNPDGHKGMIEYMTDHATVIMRAAPNGDPIVTQPVYVDYFNNQGEPETGDLGDEYVMTTPDGNYWVNKNYDNGNTGFGGTTGGGWGAFELGGPDTSSRGYGNDSLPAPVDAANLIAQHVLDSGPFEHYSQPGEPLG